MTLRFVLDDVTVRYGKVTARADISVSFSPGGLAALVGPNGSGKSSLLRAVNGLVPFLGDVGIEGELSAHIGFLPQDLEARAALTVVETVMVGRMHSLGLWISREDLDRARSVSPRVAWV